MRMEVRRKWRNKMVNKNLVSPLICFVQLVYVFYHFPGSADNPHSLLLALTGTLPIL